MRDICTESVIPISPTFWDKMLKYIFLGLLVVSVVLVLAGWTVGIVGIIVFLIALYFHMPKTDGEYEYIHTNDVFDVDIVTRSSRRKQLCSIDLNRVDLVARADSDEIRNFGQMQQKDYSANAPLEMKYAMVYTKGGKREKILIQLDDRMHRSLKQWIPGKVK